MKLGVSHQKPETLTPGHLAYLKQMGVEYLEGVCITYDRSRIWNWKKWRLLRNKVGGQLGLGHL